MATYRALGIRMDKPRADDAGVNALLWQAGSIGIYPLAWPRPDGQPIDNASWSSPARLMASMNVHYTLSGGWWPTVGRALPRAGRTGCRRRGCGSPTSSTTSRGSCCTRRATDRLLQACCDATGCKPQRDGSTRSTSLVQWGMPRLLTTFLDSPDFLSR